MLSVFSSLKTCPLFVNFFVLISIWTLLPGSGWGLQNGFGGYKKW